MEFPLGMGGRNGTEVAASVLPGFDSRPGAIGWSSLLLVLDFSPGSPVFLHPQKPTFPNSSSTRIEGPHENQLRLIWLPL